MKKLLVASVAVVALIATDAASAADMPVKAPPRVPVPVATTWTGCYINGGAGYGFFSRSNTQPHSDRSLGTRLPAAAAG